MKFLTYFRAFSYAMIAVAMLALVLAGGLSYGLALVFFAVMVVSWSLEGTRWQLPERFGLAIVLRQYPFVDGWLTAKVVALVVYIVLGTIALKRGRSRGTRIVAWIAAQAVFLYIVGVALTRDALPFL